MIQFDFDNLLALEPGAYLTSQVVGEGDDELTLRVWRALRQFQFPHQPQAALNGAILGMETILELIKDQQPARGFRWRLYQKSWCSVNLRSPKFIQRGITDGDGRSGEIKIDLPYEPAAYRVIVIGPRTARQQRQRVTPQASYVAG